MQLPTSCEACGACCLVVTSPPFRRIFDGPGEDAWERLKRERPELLREVVAAERERRAEGLPLSGSPCLWYDRETRLCRHHDLRPAACRAFEIGDVDCLDARRRAGIEREPGSPNGSVLPGSNRSSDDRNLSGGPSPA